MLSLPRGVADFNPNEAIYLNYLVATTEAIFKRFGFYPLITPAIETKDILQAKNYGEEANKQMYMLEGEDAGLRFDLTVPMARFIAMNKDLPLPFKRYQIGFVWRRDEPQYMRKREFLQADADIVGSEDIASDAEVVAVAATVLDTLGLDYEIHLNSRVLIDELFGMVGLDEGKHIMAMRTLDKLSKVGSEEVLKQLQANGVEAKIANAIVGFVTSKDEKGLEELASYSQKAKEEAKRLEELISLIKEYGIRGSIRKDPSLVRGLDYYTGFVWEFSLKKGDKALPSVCGGGRYDRLIGSFESQKPLPATGISIGLSRVFEATYTPTNISTYARVYVAYVSEEDFAYALKAANTIRANGINADLNLHSRSLSKQLGYAASIGVPYAIIIGEEERKLGKVKLRDMLTGSEELLSIDEAIAKLKG